MRRLIFVLILPALLAGCFHGKLNRQALHPREGYEMIPEDMELAYEIFVVPVDGARIHAWFRPAADSRDTVVVCGGNTGNKSLYIPLARELTKGGYNVVLFDYRGFGFSTGEPDLWSLTPDTIALLEAVRARPDTERVGLLGISLGSTVALGAAEDRPELIEAIVAEGSFNPREKLDQMVGGFLGTLTSCFIIPAGWNVVANAEELPQPILYIHGSEDWVTPIEEATVIFRAASESQAERSIWIAVDAGHSPGIAGLYGLEYTRQVARFFDRTLKSAPDATPRTLVTAEGDRATFRSGSPVENPLPLEVVLVDSAGEVKSRRLWLANRSVVVDLGEAEPAPFPTATIPACPIVPEDDGGWRRDSAYQRDRRLFEEIEDEIFDRLGFGALVRMADITITFRTEEDERPDDEIRAGCEEIQAKLDAAVAAGIHPLVEPLYGRAYRSLADGWRKVGENGKALAAGERRFDLLPENLHAHFRLNDASWDLGISPAALANTCRTLSGLAPDEPTKAAWLRRAEEWDRRADARTRRMEAWAAAQRQALD